MNKKQALNLLSLIADLYGIVNAPELPEPPKTNGQGAAERAKAATQPKES